MEFAFDKQLPPWTTLQQLWLLAQVTEKRMLQAIYDDFTAEDADTRPDNVERWAGSFNAFKKRLLRLTKSGIDPAIDTTTGERMAFDLGTARGRYDYWTYLAKTTASLSTRMHALQMVEKLAPQFREVGENELDPQGYMTVGNPMRIKWTAAHLTELIHLSADEYGGIHKIINFEGMNLSALELLVRAAVAVYRGKLVSSAMPFDIKKLLGEADHKESDDLKTMRLKSMLCSWKKEVQSLPYGRQVEINEYVNETGQALRDETPDNDGGNDNGN